MQAIITINMTECWDPETDEETERTEQRYKEAIQAMIDKELWVYPDTGYQCVIEITEARVYE